MTFLAICAPLCTPSSVNFVNVDFAPVTVCFASLSVDFSNESVNFVLSLSVSYFSMFVFK